MSDWAMEDGGGRRAAASGGSKRQQAAGRQAGAWEGLRPPKGGLAAALPGRARTLHHDVARLGGDVGDGAHLTLVLAGNHLSVAEKRGGGGSEGEGRRRDGAGETCRRGGGTGGAG